MSKVIKRLLTEAWARYGKRVVSREIIQRKPQQSQDTGVHQSMLLLLKSAPLEFEFVMLWRYDLVTWPAADIRQNHMTTLLNVAQRDLVWFEDDWAYSFPGWYSNCAIGALLHRCMSESLICIRSLKLNFKRYYQCSIYRTIIVCSCPVAPGQTYGGLRKFIVMTTPHRACRYVKRWKQ